MRITVIGCGRWGSLIAWYLDRTGHAVTLYGRPGSRHMQRFLATRRNDLLELPESIRLSTNLSCVRQAEIVVISIGSQGLQGLMDQLRPLALREGQTSALARRAWPRFWGASVKNTHK